MKFILNETKFALNENKRFLLDERFNLNEDTILTEATAVEVAQKWTEHFLATLDNTQEVLKKYSEFAGVSSASQTTKTEFTKIKDTIKKAANEIEVSLSMPKSDREKEFVAIKSELTTYINAIQEVTNKLTDKKSKDTKTLLISKIKDLEEFGAKPNWSDSDIEDLGEVLAWVEENVYPLFDTTSIDDQVETAEKFKAVCDDCIKISTKIKESLPEKESLSGILAEIDESTLKDYINIMKTAAEATTLPEAEKINRGLIIANLDTYSKSVQILKQNYEKINQSSVLSAIRTKVKAEAEAKVEAEAKAKAEAETDWKIKYAKAVDKMAVIEEFIYNTWKNDEGYKKVLKVKAAVAQECESYGFRPSKDDGKNGNPFINFISAVYLKYGEMTPATYNVIHNLVADKMLNGQDLVGIGPLGKANLLFCKAFYRLEPAVAKLYLVKQYHLLRAGKKPDTFNSVEEMVFNILYKFPKLQLGNDFTAANSEGLELNSMNVIEDLEIKWIGEITKATIEDTDAKNKVIINAELLNQIGSTDNAVEVLATLALKFSSNENITKLVTSCAEATSLMSKTTTITAIQKLVSRVERLYKLQTINATQALNLIKSIFESDKFELTKN